MEEILRYLNNYFFRFKATGKFEIRGNKIIGLKGEYFKGQYLLIEGSLFNDGVIEVLDCSNNEITIEKPYNEKFEGVIYSLAVPTQLRELKDKIEEFKLKNKNSDKVSESFEGYSYTKAAVNGEIATWKDVFKEELRPFRQMYDGKRRVKEVQA